MNKKEGHARYLTVTEFKAKCLRLLEETRQKGNEYTITKNGVPLAKVIPIQKNTASLKDSLKGLIQIKGDIVHFDTSDDWEVLKD